MNRTLKTIATAVLIIAVLSSLLSVANSTNYKPSKPPKTLPADLVYWTDSDSTRLPIASKESVYELELDGNPQTWYYLDVDSMNPVPTNGIYCFYLETPPLTDTAFWSYWDSKGVSPYLKDDGTWQYIMTQIIFGSSPMFMLKVEDGDYMLIDGLQFSYYVYANSKAGIEVAFSDVPLTPLRLGGDYPGGAYSFSCDNAFTLDWIGASTNDLYYYSVILSIESPIPAPPVPPKQYDVNMEYWTSINPTLNKIDFRKKTYQLTLDDNPNTFYYLNVSQMTPAPQNGYYFFLLNPPTDPAFLEYWAAKGVTPNMSDDGTWQSVMSRIIDGDMPIFLLRVENGKYMLVDGLQFWYAFDTLDNVANVPLNPLRLNGDYPAGTYTFNGNIGIGLNWNIMIQYPDLNGYNFTMTIK